VAPIELKGVTNALDRAEGLTLDHCISELVNQAYGLTAEEIDLMWKTAPPRMPFPCP
jgi:hypothetical protein